MSLKLINITNGRVLTFCPRVITHKIVFSFYLGGNKWAKNWKSRKCDTPFQNYSITNEGLYAVGFNNGFDY